MRVRIFKLGKVVRDTVTCKAGMLTHCQLLPETGAAFYCFQPKGLTKDTGLPLENTWITPSRIVGGELHTVKLPTQVLGTIVRDKASGYTGTAVTMIVHISGCVHFEVQSSRVAETTGLIVGVQNFDILRLEGKAIPVLSEKQAEQVKKDRPSPSPIRSYTPKIL